MIYIIDLDLDPSSKSFHIQALHWEKYSMKVMRAEVDLDLDLDLGLFYNNLNLDLDSTIRL